jgi:hypothetical protein
MDKVGKISLCLGLIALILIILFLMNGGDYVIWGGPDCEVGTPCPLIGIAKGISIVAIYHGVAIFLIVLAQAVFAFRTQSKKRILRVFAILNFLASIAIGGFVLIYLNINRF